VTTRQAHDPPAARLCGRVSRPAVSLVILALIATGCAAPAPPLDRGPSDGTRSTDRAKSITVGITSAAPATSIAAFGTPAGGWSSLTEVHSEGLVTGTGTLSRHAHLWDVP
jgi:hypothetical protein